MSSGKIIGVSLGPGDPGLITVKGLEALRRADKIYYPASGRGSYSLSILGHYGLDADKLFPMMLEMTKDRSFNLGAYDMAFHQMAADCVDGLTVAFVSEGDISFYSTFIHLLRRIRDAALPVEMIAGVPSFLAATAAHREPLAVLDERMAIVPSLASSHDLEYYLLRFHTVVLIKVRQAAAFVGPLVRAGMATMLYSERVGTEEEFLSRSSEEMEGRETPYFSLVILKSNLCTMV